MDSEDNDSEMDARPAVTSNKQASVTKTRTKASHDG